MMSVTFERFWVALASLPVMAFFLRPFWRKPAQVLHAAPETTGGAQPSDREFTAPPVVEIVPSASQGIPEAIRYAFEECGLPLHKLRGDFDVAATGKLHDVIHHASVRMSKAHPVRTVADITRLLELS